jgi:hypothetical protein
MIKQAETENIVVHNPAPAVATPETRIAEAATGQVRQDTAVSGLYAVPTERRKKRPWALIAGAPVLILLVAYLGYKFVFEKAGVKPTPTTVTTPTTPEEEAAIDVGSMEIDSDPAGARVLVNGTDTGLVTPARLEKLTLGEEYQIKIEKENYKEASRTVAVTSEEPIKIKETLAALPKGVVEIASNPPGAKILVNDQDTGLVTPQRIENLEIAKTYNIKLSAPNYYDWTGTAEVKGFDPVAVTAALTPVPPPPPVTPTIPETPVAPPTTTTPETPITPVVPETPVATPTPPVTPPAPPPAVVTGRLSVTSDPPGAKIYLNGENTGRTTPTTLDGLSPGKRVNLALFQKGYEDWRRTVTVEGDKTVPVYASLKKEPSATPPPPPPPPPTPPKETKKEETAKKPEEKPRQPPPPPPVREPAEEKPVAAAGKPGSLAVTSDPSGADVYINSEYKGKTPLRVNDVSPGTVKVAVSKDGYMKQTQTVKIGPGENKSTGTIKLGGMFGEIYVNSSPPRATVIFDGTITSKTPVTIRKVPRDQKHTIRIKLDGYRDWETTVSLSDKESKRFDVQLEKN